ncbi:hypothetical protein D9M71_553420 [compost metagenome]
MGNRVHAGGSRELCRQPEGQCRVTDGGLGHHMGRDHPHLAPVLEYQDGTAPDLAPRAGRGRHRNHRRGCRGDPGQAALDHRKALQRAVVPGTHSHPLGQVDCRATANGDDAITAICLEHGHGLTHGMLVGVGWRTVVDRQLCGGAAEGVQRRIDDTGGTHATVGHDQRPGYTNALTFGRQARNDADVELNLGDVVDQGHRAFAASWRCCYGRFSRTGCDTVQRQYRNARLAMVLRTIHIGITRTHTR